MTTIKQVLDKFRAKYRYSEKLENIAVGSYTFDEAHTDRTGFLLEFTSQTNPDVWLRINDDKGAVLLIQKIDDETVNITKWMNGTKSSKTGLLKYFKPKPEDMRKPLPTKD